MPLILFWSAATPWGYNKPTPAPLPAMPQNPQPFKPTPAARIFPVWVARSGDEFQSFPKVQPGWAAICWSDEPFADLGAGFNWDTWPSSCGEGIWSVSHVLSQARIQDTMDPLHDGLLREDYILHEIAGHGFLKVSGGDEDNGGHVSGNTLMNHNNGPKTANDRQLLRDVLFNNVDAFRVHVGPP